MPTRRLSVGGDPDRIVRAGVSRSAAVVVERSAAPGIGPRRGQLSKSRGTAAVFVDGTYVGTPALSSDEPAAGLVSGRHHIGSRHPDTGR